MTAALPLALAALLPVIVGPLPAEQRSITAALCNGGTITIPLGNSAPAQDGPCHPKACHAGTCRAKTEPKGPKPTI
ncbi:MAG: hypothetical protein GW858_06035 [Sphingomonadales bacterium]|nr:hypothetical protein [Sphingomonadales bacterium]NCQ20769.1 hypothetical protein [Sphingomonadales bacterium]NCT03768.1 hypothetical protein [Sphingomonadales bacterium]